MIPKLPFLWVGFAHPSPPTRLLGKSLIWCFTLCSPQQIPNKCTRYPQNMLWAPRCRSCTDPWPPRVRRSPWRIFAQNRPTEAEPMPRGLAAQVTTGLGQIANLPEPQELPNALPTHRNACAFMVISKGFRLGQSPHPQYSKSEIRPRLAALLAQVLWTQTVDESMRDHLVRTPVFRVGESLAGDSFWGMLVGCKLSF